MPVKRQSGMWFRTENGNLYSFTGLKHADITKHIEQAMSDWRARITINPKQCAGRPCIRGMRIRVTDVLDLLAAGLSREEVLEELPDLEPEDIEAALRFASRRLDHPVMVA